MKSKTTSFVRFCLSSIFLTVLSQIGSAQTCSSFAGGTHFDPLTGYETNLYNYIQSVEQQGPTGNTLSTPAAFPTDLTDFAGTKFVGAQTSNPSKLNPDYVDVDDNMFVVTVPGTYKPMFNYTVTGLKPGSKYTVTVKMYLLSKAGSACALANPWLNNSLMVGVPDASGNGLRQKDFKSTEWGQAITITDTGTLAKNSTVINFQINSGYNIASCTAIGISDISVTSCINPRIKSSQGNEVCTGEQTLFELDREYNATAYKWEKSLNGGSTWTTISTKKSVTSQMLANAVFRATVDGVVTDNFAVTTITCCTNPSGQASSRETIFLDDFGRFPAAHTYINSLGKKVTTPAADAPFRAPVDYTLPSHTYQSTGAVNDGSYAVSSYMYKNVAPWMGAIAEDHSQEPDGGYLLINVTASYKGLIYQRTIKNLCEGKELYFDAFVGNASGASPPILNLIIYDATGSTILAQSGVTTVTAGGWIRLKVPTFTLQTGQTSIVLKIMSTGENWSGGNDLVVDDIKIMACAPPSVDIFSDFPTLTKDMEVCTTPIVLEFSPSSLLTSFYGGNPSYLFQWTTDPTDPANWMDLDVPQKTTKYTITPSKTSGPYAGLTEGDKVYYRVVAATDAILTAAGGFFDETNTCKNFSISSPIETTIKCPKCTPIVSTDALTISTPATELCPGNTAILSSSKIHPSVAGAKYDFTWYKGTTTSGTPIKTTKNTTTATEFSDTYSLAASDRGTYILQVVDHDFPNSTSCQYYDTITITDHVLPTYTISGGGDFCTGTSAPAVTFTLVGEKPFSLSWSDGTTTTSKTGITTSSYSITPTATSTYTVTAISDKYCTGVSTTSKAIVKQNPLPTPVISSSDADNIICLGEKVTLDAGTFSSYLWSTAQTTKTIEVSAAGKNKIAVAVTDANGCKALSDTVTVTVNALPTVSTTDKTVCLGLSTTLSGIGAKTYLWSDAVIDGTAFTPAATKTYSVTGTDANGCKNTATAKVTVNPLPTVGSTDKSVCMGQSTTLNGTGAQSYTWSDGVTNGLAFTPTATKTYTVTGTDANGCKNTANAIVTVNSTFTLVTSDKTVCLGKSATLSATGAKTYTWSDGVSDGVAFTPTATKIYSVTGTDANGCQSTATATVTVNALPSISANDKIICLGKSATLSATGAKTYTWSDGVSDGVAFTPTATKTYTVTGIDVNGCESTATASVTVNSLPILTASDKSVCVGQTTNLSGSGAKTYTWSDGVSNGIDFTPAATKTYTVTGIDANGCENTTTATVTVNPLPTPSITSNDADNSICFGNTLTLNAGTYKQYAWSNLKTTATIDITQIQSNTPYSVTVTDNNNCTNFTSTQVSIKENPVVDLGSDRSFCADAIVLLNAAAGMDSYLWSTNETAPSINVTKNGDYTITVTKNGCTGTDAVHITILASTSIDLGADKAICVGDSAMLSPGAGYESYQWNTGASGAVLYAKTAGKYIVTVTSGTCTAKDSIVITTNPLPTVSISSSDADNVICQNESITLDAGLFTTYTWQNMASNQKITVAASGDYAVTASDANGCKNSATAKVIVNPLPNPTIVSSDADNAICFGEKAMLSTAISYKAYSWTPNASSPSIEISNLGKTDVSLEVTDANNCKNTTNTSVMVHALPTPQIVSSDADNTVCDGEKITLRTQDTYNAYLWTPNATTASISITAVGTTAVNLEVTDANGCKKTITDQVIINPLPTPQITTNDIDNTVCEGEKITVSTNKSYNSYAWIPSASSASIDISTVGKTNVSVEVTDANNCKNTATSSVTINPLPVPQIVSSDADNTVCFGESITINTKEAYTSYLWTPNATSASISIATVGTTNISVEVTDANNCKNSTTGSVTINALPIPVITSSDADNMVCDGEKITLSTKDTYKSYAWNPSATTPSITVSKLNKTDVTLEVTDANNCKGTANTSVMIHALPTPQIVSSDADNIACEGETITLSTKESYTSYNWTPNATTPSITVSKLNKTNISLEVTDVNNCKNTASSSVTINPLPIPTIISSDSDNSVCDGEKITLSTKESYKSYKWNSSTPTPSFEINTVGKTDVTLEVTDANDCHNNAATSVVIHPLPTPEFVSTDPDNSVCEGSSVTLSTKVPYQSYSWTYGSSKSTNPSVTISTVGSTSVKLDVRDNNTCSQTINTTVNVNLLPVILIPISNNGIYCDKATLNAVVNNVSVLSYNWSTNESTRSITVNSSNNNSNTYIVTVTSEALCTATKPVPVTINPSPHPQLPNQKDICNGQTTSLQDQSSTPAQSYKWSLNGNYFTETSNTLSNITQNGVYKLEAFIGTCPGEATSLVIINSSPQLKPIRKNICYYQDSLRFTINANVANWYAGNDTAEVLHRGLSYPIVLNDNQDSVVVYATITDSKSCVSPISTVTLRRVPEYKGLEIIGATTRCESQSSGNLFTIKGSLQSKKWSSLRTFNLYNPDSTIIMIKTFKLGIDTVSFSTTDANACVYSTSKLIYTAPQPVADFEWEAQSKNMSIRYINHSDSSFVPDVNRKLANTYKWTFLNNGDAWRSSTQKDVTLTYPYGYHDTRLLVTNEYGCTDSVTKTVFMDVTTGLYTPNAFHPGDHSIDLAEFRPKGMSLKEYEISIFDQWGNLLWNSTKLIDGHPAEGWDGTYQGNIMKSDTYIWRIKAKFADGSWWTGENGSNIVLGSVILLR